MLLFMSVSIFVLIVSHSLCILQSCRRHYVFRLSFRLCVRALTHGYARLEAFLTGLPSTSSCILHLVVNTGWLGSRVVGVLDSGTAGPGFKSGNSNIRYLCCGNSLRQTVHTHRASVH